MWPILFSLVALTGADFAQPPVRVLEPSAPQWTEQVTSYGEEGRDLSALFVPFFAARDFVPHLSRAARLKIKDVDAVYFGPNNDYVAVMGRYNCVILRYYGITWYYPKGDDGNLKRRAEAFRDEIARFLAELPEPRPTPKQLDLRSQYCEKPGPTSVGESR